MQMLHCIEQVATNGGDNTFTDSFRVAYDLKVCYFHIKMWFLRLYYFLLFL